MTERLYYTDPYLKTFTAIVAAGGGSRVYLDRTAFYPTSGGQPHDSGSIAGVRVIDVVDEDDHIAHILSSPMPTHDGSVECQLDWARRFDHMQQHTGQHLLSAVLSTMFEAHTVAFHMSADVSTIELAGPPLDAAALRSAESRANELIFENRPVLVTFEDADAVSGLRKPSERTGTLRVITIEDLDRSACGGTHVRSTGEIGCILLRGTERIRGNLRLEFLCGLRAVRRARADFESLAAAARAFSCPLDQVPAMVVAQCERMTEVERARRKVAMELAGLRGRELYSNTVPDHELRLHVREADALGDDLRAEAQSFTAGAQSAFIAFTRNPAALFVATSKDLRLHAGNTLKPLLNAEGGRGGGAAQMAQGSIPNAGAIDSLVAALRDQLLRTPSAE